VNLVELRVRVTDRAGRAVPGLGESAFQLFVDDTAQKISVFHGEDAPVTAGLVIDNSASMAKKRTEVIAAATAFARASNPQDEMFVVHFNHNVRFGLPEATPFTGSVPELEAAIGRFSLGGATAFYDALLAAEVHFRLAAYSHKVLLTVTDGGDNASSATLAEVIDRARENRATIYPIGIFGDEDRDSNPAVLEELAQQTGGRASTLHDVTEVTETCVRIAREIREQYTLGFAGANDGQYHRIRVTVVDPKHGPLRVHTRAGYLANRPSGEAVQ